MIGRQLSAARAVVRVVGETRRRTRKPTPAAARGVPTTSAYAGTSFVTTEPAPTIAQRPIFMPGKIVAFAPIAAPSSTCVSPTSQSPSPRGAKVRIGRARPAVVREHGVRTDEDAAAERHAVIDARIILQLRIVADRNVKVDEGALSDDAPRADVRARANLRLMPNARIVADGRAVFNEGRPRERTRRSRRSRGFLDLHLRRRAVDDFRGFLGDAQRRERDAGARGGPPRTPFTKTSNSRASGFALFHGQRDERAFFILTDERLVVGSWVRNADPARTTLPA